MKILIACTPATGHINPLFSIGRMLVEEGHEVVGLSANAMRERIEGVGATFRPFPAGADFDLRNPAEVFPEILTLPPGPERTRLAMRRGFIDPLPAQREALQQVLRDFPADVIIGDDFLFGALPMLLGPRSERPPIVLCGTSVLHWRRDDGAPHFAPLPPASTAAQHQEYAALSTEYEAEVGEPNARYLNDCFASLGLEPLAMHVLDATVTLPDAYLQLTAPGFEFPRRELPASLRFVGTLPIIPNQAPIPPWAHELDGSRKVVLVTQGTVSNYNFDELIVPTLAALANEPDVLVVVTAGGRSIDSIPGPIPSNARMASYLPFEWILPKADAFITNGGHGSVNQALSFGVPLIAAGLTADKGAVNARVAWSGSGIDLKTNNPTAEALRAAIRVVLDDPTYRLRASILAKEFASIDTRAEILGIIEQVSGVEVDKDSTRHSARAVRRGL